MRASAQKHIYNSVSGCCHAGYVVVTEKTLNFYKYNTALYKIFVNEPLLQCALSLIEF